MKTAKVTYCGWNLDFSHAIDFPPYLIYADSLVFSPYFFPFSYSKAGERGCGSSEPWADDPLPQGWGSEG